MVDSDLLDWISACVDETTWRPQNRAVFYCALTQGDQWVPRQDDLWSSTCAVQSLRLSRGSESRLASFSAGSDVAGAIWKEG